MKYVIFYKEFEILLIRIRRLIFSCRKEMFEWHNAKFDISSSHTL